MNQWLTFASHFVLGGLLIATINWLLKRYGSLWAGFIYGAIPLTYIYLYVVAGMSAPDRGPAAEQRTSFARASLYTVVSWIVFVGATFVVGRWCHPALTLLVALIAFLFVIVAQWRGAKYFGIHLG